MTDPSGDPRQMDPALARPLVIHGRSDTFIRATRVSFTGDLIVINGFCVCIIELPRPA